MLHEQTHEKLIQMKLFGMAASFKERLGRIDHQSLSATELFGLVVDDEYLYRENRKLTARLKVARFKERGACLEHIDYAAARGLRKDQVLELAQHRWIAAHQNLIISGPSGSGKSFIAQALGEHACRHGHSVQYLRLPALLQQFVQARAQGTYAPLLKRLGKLSVLIIDDVGLSSLAEAQTQDLLETLEERYGVGSTVTTSQLPVADWHEYLGGGRIADAILDRLVHNAHRIELNARESLRKPGTPLNHDGQSDK
jgi:DNA replication protein DnaC